MTVSVHPVQTVLHAASRLVEPAVGAMLRAALMQMLVLAGEMREQAQARQDVPAEVHALLDSASFMLRGLLARLAAREASIEAAREAECAARDGAQAPGARRRATPSHRRPDARRGGFVPRADGRDRVPAAVAAMGLAAFDTG